MKRFRLFLFVVPLAILLSSLWLVAQRWREERDWHLWAQGKLVAVHVERALYIPTRGDGFLTHVRVTNKTSRTLQVNVHPSVRPIRSSITFRGTSIAGRQPIQPTVLTFGRQKQARLRQINRRPNRLITIAAGESLDYFIDDFINSRSRLVSSIWGGTANSRLGVFMSGSLPVTDGQIVEIINEDTGVETTRGVRYGNGGVSILSPGDWKPLPKSARVLK